MTLNEAERLLLLCALALCSCADEGTADDAGDPGTSGTNPTASEGMVTAEPDDGMTRTASTIAPDSGSDDAPTAGTDPDCTDQMILDLGLVDGTISAGGVTNAADGAGWASTVDATAGGITEASNNPWIYLRFTSEGLEKIEVDDLQALESIDWDIAAKRIGIRLNSGVSGASTVAAAASRGRPLKRSPPFPLMHPCKPRCCTPRIARSSTMAAVRGRPATDSLRGGPIPDAWRLRPFRS